jgi:hypothetical protein
VTELVEEAHEEETVELAAEELEVDEAELEEEAALLEELEPPPKVTTIWLT